MSERERESENVVSRTGKARVCRECDGSKQNFVVFLMLLMGHTCTCTDRFEAAIDGFNRASTHHGRLPNSIACECLCNV